MTRASRERELRAELRRLKSAISAIHDRLHAGDVDGAHEACECALEGGEPTQPHLTASASASVLDFAARFNRLASEMGARACAVVAVPSATVPGATNLQIMGEVTTCKIVESMLRGAPSIYMGDAQGGDA